MSSLKSKLVGEQDQCGAIIGSEIDFLLLQMCVCFYVSVCLLLCMRLKCLVKIELREVYSTACVTHVNFKYHWFDLCTNE